MIHFSEIPSYRPRNLGHALDRADGATEAAFFDEHGVVEVFTFKGDDHHRAFTNFKMWIYPHMYDATLPRHYHARWLRRLAHQFAWLCHQQKAGQA